MLSTPEIGTTMAVEQITPELANKYLATAPENRRARRGKIEQYARDMTAGKWHSSVLRFDQQGNLVDGQHRLWAVVVSDKSQTFYVERGLSPEAIRTIDQGLPRTGGDVLAIMGEPNAVTLASAIRFARWFENFPGSAPSGQSRVPFSPDEIIAYLDANPTIRDHVRNADAARKHFKGFTSSGLSAALRHLEAKINPDLAREFWEQMTTGANMQPNTGPLVLRNYIVNDQQKPRIERMTINELAAMSIKAWNFWQYGKEVKQLRWTRGATLTEAFPTLGTRPAS